MGTPSVSEEPSSGIFSDAVNIGHFNSGMFSSGSSMGRYNSSQLENSQDFGMLVGDGVLSQDEAKMFKKVQKIVTENKSLKNALVVNSDRLQHHVDDCIQWKEKHYNIEESLKDQLKTEKQRSQQLQSRLEFFSKAMNISASSSSSSTSTASSPSPLPSSANMSIDLLVFELSKKSKMLTEVFSSSNEEGDNSEDGVICQAYEEAIGSISEFCSGRNVDELDKKLLHVQSICLPLESHNGKILKDVVESIKNSVTDYQTAISFTQTGNQIPLAQHVQLKHQLESIIADNERTKEDLEKSVQQCTEKDDKNTQLRKQNKDMEVSNSLLSSVIQDLRLKVDELENCRSVEVLDMTPQQQPREIKQLEANIESYKKTIHTLKEQNEMLNNELSETIHTLKEQNEMLNNDLSDTTQSFAKVEEENAEMSEQIEEQQETIERLKGEIDRLNDSISNTNELDSMVDISSLQMSPEQTKTALQKLSIQMAEKDAMFRSLTEELERLQEKQLVTYVLPENTAKEQELLQQLETKEKSINDAQEKLKVKEDENSTLIKDFIEKLNIKEHKVKSASEKLKNKDEECIELAKKITAIESQKNLQKVDSDSKTRIQRNREAKDADKINRLIKWNDNVKKDIETMKKERDEMRKHIEELQTFIDAKKLSKENDCLATKSMCFINDEDVKMVEHEVNVSCSESSESFDEYTRNLISENSQLLEDVKSLQLQVLQLQEDNGEMQTNLRSLDEQHSALQAQNATLKEEKNNLREHNSNLSLKFKTLNDSFDEQNSALQEQNATLKKEKNNLREHNSNLSLKFKGLNDSFGEQHSALQAQNATLEEEKNNLRVHNSDLSLKFKRLNDSFQAESVTANEELTNRCTDLEEKLEEEIELNEQLQQVKKELEKHVSSNRKDMMEMQQQIVSLQKRERTFSDVHEQLQSSELTCDKLKRDNKQTYSSLQAKVGYAKELEEKVDHLTGELVGAKELIGELQEKGHAGKEVIGELREKERVKELECSQLRDQLEEVMVLKMQLDVYKNDFQAERSAREDQQTTLLQERERAEALTVENLRLKEEMQRQQRHGAQAYYNRNTNPVETRQGGYQHNYARGQNVDGQDNRWQQQQQQPQQPQPQHPQHPQQQQQQNPGGNWQVYGRGNEQFRSHQRQPATRLDDDEQRKCPKCQEVSPDLDSLQIHVMECLDKN